MAAEQALALVVRGTDWSETSRITTLFTREFGKVRGLAKGGRRLKSSFDVSFDLLTVCRVVFLRKAHGGLDLLTEARLSPPMTWDDYQKLAETIATWAPGQTVYEPWDPAFRGTLFFARAAAAARHPANYSVFLDIETGTSRIATPPFEQALHRMRAVQPVLSPDSITGRPDQIGQPLQNIDAHGALAALAIAEHAIGIARQRLVDGKRGAPGTRQMLRARQCRQIDIVLLRRPQ